MLILTIILFIIMALILGVSLYFIGKRRLIKDICFWLMKYVKCDYNFTYVCLMTLVYIFNLFTFGLVIAIIYRFNILPYFFIQKQYIPYIFVGIIGALSLNSLIVCFLIMLPSMRKGKNIGEEVLSIPWIKFVYSVPVSFRWIIVISSAFFEELFFRGFLYIVLREKFPKIGFVIPVIIVGFLFALQQMIKTVTIKQKLIIGLSSIVISVIGCLLIEYTGSLIPAFLSHISFVIYYFGENENDKKYFIVNS